MPYPYYIIIDTETSGMPGRYDIPLTDTAHWPYIIQIAWLVLDNDGNLVKEESHYLKNRGVEIDKQALQLHGITPELLRQKGVSKRGMLRRLYKDIKRYKPLIVGHFVEFDLKMLVAESNRNHLHLDFGGLPTYCTMLSSGMKSHHPERQHPSLSELYQQCFNKPLLHGHNALNDARASAMVFLHLLENGKFDDTSVKYFVPETTGTVKKTIHYGLSLMQRIKNLISR